MVWFYGELASGCSRSQVLHSLAATFGKSSSTLEGLFFSGKKTLLGKNKSATAAGALIQRFARYGLVCHKTAAIANDTTTDQDSDAPELGVKTATENNGPGSECSNFNGDLYMALERSRSSVSLPCLGIDNSDVVVFRKAMAASLATVDPTGTIDLFRQRVEYVLGEYFFDGYLLPELLAITKAYFKEQSTVLEKIIRKYKGLCSNNAQNGSVGASEPVDSPLDPSFSAGEIVFSQDAYVQSLQGLLYKFTQEYQQALLGHETLYDRLIQSINAAINPGLLTYSAFLKNCFGNLDRANRLLAARHGGKALNAAEASLAAYPAGCAPRFTKAKILFFLQKQDDCYQILKSMTQLSDMSLLDVYFFAMLASACCYELHKYDESLQYLQIILSLDNVALAKGLGVSGHQNSIFCQAIVQAQLGKCGLCRSLLQQIQAQGFDFENNKVLRLEVVEDAFRANSALMAFYSGLARSGESARTTASK